MRALAYVLLAACGGRVAPQPPELVDGGGGAPVSAVAPAALCCPTARLEGTYWAQPCGVDGGLLQGDGVGDWVCDHAGTVVACQDCAIGDACGLGGIFGLPSHAAECSR